MFFNYMPYARDVKLSFLALQCYIDGLAARELGVASCTTPAGYRRPAPRIGEHTSEVLRELAFDAATIASLRDAGVVGGEE